MKHSFLRGQRRAGSYLTRCAPFVMLLLLLVNVPSPVQAEGEASDAVLAVTTTEDELNQDGDCSLREALTAANTNATVDACPAGGGVDTITLAPAATYGVATIDNVTNGRNAFPSITSSIIIQGNNATLIRNANAPNLRYFHVAAGGNLTLRAVTLTNGVATMNTTLGQQGGAILNLGTLTVNHAVFTGNQAGFDAAALYTTGTATIDNAIFRDNRTINGSSGAIENLGVLTVNGSMFINNQASNGRGGAIVSHNSLLINQSTFTKNVARFSGGGALSGSGALTIHDSTFTENTASTDGGAISFGGDGSISNSVFTGNTSLYGDGGGLYYSRGNLTVRDTLFTNQQARSGGAVSSQGVLIVHSSTLIRNSAGQGGAIRNNSQLTLVNSTLAQNSAYDGGALHNFGAATLINASLANNISTSAPYDSIINASRGTVTLRNTLLMNSSSPKGNCGGGGVFVDGGNNLQFPGNSCGASIGVMDAKLGPLAYNGGATLTLALLPGSPAIDAGNDATCAATPVSNLDQRGRARPQGARCDIGAFEGNGQTILLSTNANGSLPGLGAFRDEDILAYDQGANTWTVVFDGSDVGLGNTDLDAFAILPNGQFLLSTDTDFNLTNFGPVDDADILAFTPTALGGVTAGSFTRFLDGSDVGLDTAGEDIDAIDFGVLGKLRLSVTGAFDTPDGDSRVRGADEDFFRFLEVSFGENSAGRFALQFDGSDVGLTTAAEDVLDTWTDVSNDDIYFTTLGNFAVNGLRGDGNDLIVCHPLALEENTNCTFTRFIELGSAGLGTNLVDGLQIGAPPAVANAVSDATSAVDDTVAYAGDDADDADELDGEETPEELETSEQVERSYLPLINR